MEVFLQAVLLRRGLTGKNYSWANLLSCNCSAALLVLIGIVWLHQRTLLSSFPRHLLGIGLGLVLPTYWRYDYRALANMTNVLLVGVVVLMILP